MHTWNMCMTIKTVVVFQGTPTETTGSMIHAYSKYSAEDLQVSEINNKGKFVECGVMSSVSDTPIDMKEVLKYELTPMPLSMFKTDGSPRICKAKSDFMNGLKVTVPTRGKTPDMTIVDGCAVLWKIQWPSANGTVQDFVKGFHKFVYDMLKKNDVMIIFDRYYDYSIKSVTRENRNVIQSSKQVKITLTGPAHDKNVVLANKDNKIQLIRILVESLKTLQLQGRESER